MSVQATQYGTYTDLIIPANVTNTWAEGSEEELEVTYSVTSIPKNGFLNRTSITSLTLPSTLESIGDSAFKNTSLTGEFTLPSTVKSVGQYVFADCPLITRVIINMTGALSRLMFSNCTSITCVEIGPNVTSYGPSGDYPAFKYCSKLTTLVIKKGLNIYGLPIVGQNSSLTNVTIASGEVPYQLCQSAKQLTTVTLNEGITTIGKSAFESCNNLTQITLPDSLTIIGSYAFYSTGLTSVDIPDNVTTIEDNAFRASKLTKINIPQNVQNVGNYAFIGCGELTEAVINNNGYLGSNAFYNCSKLQKVDIKNTVTNIGSSAFEYCSALTDLTINSQGSIGYRAFRNCTALENITIKNTITDIGYEAFYNCKSLKSITLNNQGSLGYGMFMYCNNLESVTIGSGITQIGYNCFKNCTNITGTITIPQTVTNIGYNAFENLNKLTAINFENPTATTPPLTIGASVFIKDSSLTSLTIPCRTISWATNAFDDCTGLESVNLCDTDPNYASDNGVIYNHDYTKVILCPPAKSGSYAIKQGCITIGESAFSSCTRLTSITLPNSVTTIEANAFNNCGIANTLTIPGSVTSVGNNAFINCTALTKLILNMSCAISSGMFQNCTNLEYVELGANITGYPTSGTAAFYKCNKINNIVLRKGLDMTARYLFVGSLGNVTSATIESGVVPDYLLNYASKLDSLTINDGVTAINAYALYYCTQLTSVVLPNSITSIGEYAFRNCSKLSNINMPLSLTTIDEYAFYSCTALSGNLVIPNAVTSIGQYAFAYCNSLDSVVTNGNLANGAFYSCKNLKSATINNGSIGDNAFYDCKEMTTLTINEGVTSIGKNAFYNCSKVSNIVNIPTTVTLINTNAFQNMTLMPGLTFTEADTPELTIQNNAFSACMGLTSITFPCRLTSWNTTAFDNCENLTEINLCENDANYTSHQGVLYSKDYSKLVLCPPGKAGHYDIKQGCVSIESSAFSSCTKLTSISFPESLTTIGAYAFSHCGLIDTLEIPGTITIVENYAFEYCTALKHVIVNMSGVIPDCLFNECTNIESAEIGINVTGYPASKNWSNAAFRNCSKLTSLVMQKGLNVYGGKLIPSGYITKVTIESGVVPPSLCSSCGKLTDVTIKEGITAIGTYAFSYTYALTSIDIPNSVTIIDNYAFNQSGITGELKLSDAVTKIGNYAFYGTKIPGELKLPKNLTTLGSYAFGKCTLITDIDIPSSLSQIGDNAFHSCTGISVVNIPRTILKIGSAAFRDCTGLTKATIYNGTIGSDAFYGCTNLATVNIHGGVTSIGNYAFYNCSSLQTVIIPSSVTELGSRTFMNCTNLTSATTNGTIGSNAFTNCSLLKNVHIQSGSIGANAFTSCPSLTTVTINNSVSNIAQKAFENNTSLKTLIFEEGLVSANQTLTIEPYAFNGCTGLEEIYNYNLTPPVVNVANLPFGTVNTENVKLYVSCLALDAYKKSHWNALIKEENITTRGNEEKLEVVYNHIVIPVDKENCKTVLHSNIKIMPESSVVFLGLSWTTNEELITALQQNIIDSNTTFSIETKLALEQWNLIANQFSNDDSTYYTLNNNYGNVSGETHDIAISTYDYTTNNWSYDFVRHTEKRPASTNEAFFIWPFKDYIVERDENGDIKTNENGNPIVVQTNIKDDYATLPMKIENAAEKTDVITIDGTTNTGSVGGENGSTSGKWFAFSNPYAGRLRATKFMLRNGCSEENHTKIQGGVIYKFNPYATKYIPMWTAVEYNGSDEVTILPGEGFMVASVGENNDCQLDFGIKDIYYPSQLGKSMINSGIVFNVKANDSKTSAKAVFNKHANNGFDSHDAYIILSENNTELVEPYFSVDNRQIMYNHFSELPYIAPINFHASKQSQVELSVSTALEDIKVSIIDVATNKETLISENNPFSFIAEQGENANRYKIKFSKKVSELNDTENNVADVRIAQNGNEFTLYGNDLYEYEVINTLGQVIKSEKLSGNSSDISINSNSGTYIIRVRTNEGSASHKVIIK